jgi:hypothetical protein
VGGVLLVIGALLAGVYALFGTAGALFLTVLLAVCFVGIVRDIRRDDAAADRRESATQGDHAAHGDTDQRPTTSPGRPEK